MDALTERYKDSFRLLDEFFKETPKEEINAIIKKYDDMRFDGPTISEYFNAISGNQEQIAKYVEIIAVSYKLIGEIIDNYEADAINLPAEMYNELKFHWKQLRRLTN